VRSTGLGRLRLAEGANSPSIRVTEVQVDDQGREVPVASWEKPVLPGDVVDPGESASASFVFLVPDASSHTLGWEVTFQSLSTGGGRIAIRGGSGPTPRLCRRPSGAARGCVGVIL
jgi:hypothetical protein